MPDVMPFHAYLDALADVAQRYSRTQPTDRSAAEGLGIVLARVWVIIMRGERLSEAEQAAFVQTCCVTLGRLTFAMMNEDAE